MPGATYPKNMTPYQVELVECALRQLIRLSRSEWCCIPVELQPSFSRYMSRDVWTGEPDLLTLQDAALLILRDAITRSGEFSSEAS
jgi:hypothetical protein